MKKLFAILPVFIFFSFTFHEKRVNNNSHKLHISDTDSARLVNLLVKLAKKEKHPLLKRHFESLLLITRDHTHGYSFNETDQKAAAGVMNFLKSDGAKWKTYLTQPRPLIMAFKSKMDGKNSYYWLFLPRNYNPGRETDAFYLELHGSGGGINNTPYRMLYLGLQEKQGGVSTQGFRRDGFMIYPWGRGDKGYRDTSEADVWECVADFDHMFKTDPKRQYLYGFSMGGAGTYSLSQKSLYRWTAIGMYSGAARNPTLEIAAKYRTIPVWLAWGEQEGRTAENNKAWRDTLLKAGVNVWWHEIKNTGHKYLGEYQDSLANWFLRQQK